MDRREPAAFLSYVRADDAHDKGMILGICDRLSAEVRVQTGKNLHIFVDRHDIDWGENWKLRIDKSLAMATVLIPVITPSYFESHACREELTKFLEREAKLRRADLVLPIYYVTSTRLEDSSLRQADPLAMELSKRQYVDWRPLRFLELDSREALRAIEDLARRMQRALKRSNQQTEPSSGKTEPSSGAQSTVSTGRHFRED